MTLQEIEAIPKPMLLVADVAPFLSCNPQSLRTQAQQDPDGLGFPVVVIGNRVLIPKDGFIHYCKYGRVFLQRKKEWTEDDDADRRGAAGDHSGGFH